MSGTTTLSLTIEQTRFIHAVIEACRKYTSSRDMDYEQVRAETAKDLYVRLMIDMHLPPEQAAETAVKNAERLIQELKKKP